MIEVEEVKAAPPLPDEVVEQILSEDLGDVLQGLKYVDKYLNGKMIVTSTLMFPYPFGYRSSTNWKCFCDK